jgi:hypothetical protein
LHAAPNTFLVVAWELLLRCIEKEDDIRRIRSKLVELFAFIYNHNLNCSCAAIRQNPAGAIRIHHVGAGIGPLNDRAVVVKGQGIDETTPSVKDEPADDRTRRPGGQYGRVHEKSVSAFEGGI